MSWTTNKFKDAGHTAVGSRWEKVIVE